MPAQVGRDHPRLVFEGPRQPSGNKPMVDEVLGLWVAPFVMAAINTRTFELWADWLRRALADGGEDRIASLVRGYFDFALAHPLLWSAIYEHRLPDGQHLSEDDLARRAELTGIVQQEVAAILPADTPLDVARYARSLIAGVHGHCSYVVTGSFALLDETDPLGSALDRVRESLAHHGAYNGANAPGT